MGKTVFRSSRPNENVCFRFRPIIDSKLKNCCSNQAIHPLQHY